MNWVHAKDIAKGDEFTAQGDDWKVINTSTELNGQVHILAYRLSRYYEFNFYYDPEESINLIRTAAEAQEHRRWYKGIMGDSGDTYDQNRYESQIRW